MKAFKALSVDLIYSLHIVVMRHNHGLKATQGFGKLLSLGLVLDLGTTEDCI